MKSVRKAVFPVAGLGTRFLPATKAMPKEMLPVVDRPLIQHVVDEAREAGIEHFIFVTGRNKGVIEDHFDRQFELEMTLLERQKHKALDYLKQDLPVPGSTSFTRQQEPLGLGHAVWCARELIGHEPFALLLPDVLVQHERGCLAQMLDAARDIPASTMVTAMARNGVAFGIQMSGTGDRWFTTPAPVVDGLYFPGYSMADAAPDLGDSAITETAGLGGFAMAAAPAIVNFVGGTPEDAIANTAAMGHITLGRNGAFTLPAMNFSGTPAGIDARKVVDTGILPVINTGIAHREPGIGQIGAGITRAPLDCFAQAVTALAAALPDQ